MKLNGKSKHITASSNYIYSAVSNKQLEFIQDSKTAYQIMKNFDSLYEKKSIASQIVYRNKLENIGTSNFSNVKKIVENFEQSVNALNPSDAVVTDE